MKVESFYKINFREDFKKFISRQDIKIKHITSVCYDDNSVRHFVFYKEKLLPKIIKILRKRWR